MFGLFVLTVMFGAFGATEYEACKARGVNDVIVCAEQVYEAGDASGLHGNFGNQ